MDLRDIPRMQKFSRDVHRMQNLDSMDVPRMQKMNSKDDIRDSNVTVPKIQKNNFRDDIRDINLRIQFWILGTSLESKN